MKTVYVVTMALQNDGFDVLGVFETEEGAKAVIKSFSKAAQSQMETLILALEP